MGAIHAEIKVLNLDRSGEARSVKAMVDTGATLTKVPAKLLKALGIRPIERRRFELADGRMIERDIGEAIILIDGHEVPCRVAFGKPGEEPLIGVTLLEQAGLAADPIRRRLVPVEYLMM